MALKRLTEAGLALENIDGGSWRTDFGALRRVAGGAGHLTGARLFAWC